MPNTSSKRELTVKKLYDMNKRFSEDSTYYGLSSNFDAHMLKNTEWGAVAYLSRSVYGANGEIYINNNSSYTTGCAGEEASSSFISSCNQYNTIKGVKASTTHNIYGVYDMSGGAWEYVMGVMGTTQEQPTEIVPKSSEFAASDFQGDNSKYIDIYSSTGGLSSRILGDATGETNGWYGDFPDFVLSSYPWFKRGGNCSAGAIAGVFSFGYDTGGGYFSFGSRLGVA